MPNAMSRAALHQPGRAAFIVAVLIAFAMLSLVMSCLIGSVSLTIEDAIGALQAALRGTDTSLTSTVFSLRLMRGATAFVTGATLALAGVLMQALLRNPLADPYVLGVSGGAAVGALAAMLMVSVAWLIDVAAFVGAMLAALLLFAFSHRDLRSGRGQGDRSLLLLSGVVLSSGCGALITLMLSVAPDSRLRGMVFWLIGDLSASSMNGMPWIVLAGALIFVLRQAHAINLMAQHGDAAQTLGAAVGPLRRGLFFCAAILTAAAVSIAGSIGFVGLIVPHACRFILGPDHRLLLPAATLVGGTFLMWADTLARTLIAPQQLPVGVMTALIGVPLFLIQLHHLRQRPR